MSIFGINTVLERKLPSLMLEKITRLSAPRGRFFSGIKLKSTFLTCLLAFCALAALQGCSSRETFNLSSNNSDTTPKTPDTAPETDSNKGTTPETPTDKPTDAPSTGDDDTEDGSTATDDDGDDVEDGDDDTTGTPTETDSGPFSSFPSLMAFRSSNSADYASMDDSIDVYHDESLDLLKTVKSNGKSLSIMRSSHFSIGNKQRTKVDPCYFLYSVGAHVKLSFSASQKEITVKSTDNLIKDAHATLFYYDTLNDKIICDGQFEEVVITDVDTTNSKITIDRGQYETTAQKWTSKPSNTIYIAPHVMTWDNVADSWSVNPYKAWEFYVDYTIDEVINGKYEGTPDGVEFDGGRYSFKDTKTKVDINLDGVADYGYVDGHNVYGLYSVKFYEELRKQLPNMIIQVDSSIVQWGYRGYSDVNGIEMENYLEAEDFSVVLNHLQQWSENIDSNLLSFSYPVTKENTLTFYCEGSTVTENNHFRLGLASSLLVGVPHAFATENSDTGGKCFDFYYWEEYFGGDKNKARWLGKPLGEAMSVMDNTTNVLKDETWTEYVGDSSYTTTFTNESNLKKLVVETVPQEIVELSSGAFYPGVAGVGFVAKASSSSLVMSDEFVLTFKAKAQNDYAEEYDFAKSKKIPRLVRVKIANSSDTKGQDILVSETEREYTLSFAMDSIGTLKTVTFLSGEEAGSLEISDIQLIKGTGQKWIRYFENGVVLVNPTIDDWDVALDHTKYKNIAGFKRLKGKQDPSINSGATGSGTYNNEFTVPAGDALFVTTY